MSELSDDDTLRYAQWDERKAEWIARSLGEPFPMVMHAIIPFAVGGSLDLYYYPNCIPGTAIATRELSELPGKGSSNRIFDNYELVMFTRHEFDSESIQNKQSPFGKAHQNIRLILNAIADYSREAMLNPNDTCEFPTDLPDLGGKCLIFDAYDRHEDREHGTFGLLAVIEVFRSEMEFARQHRGSVLLARLKNKGVYPYSDMDRAPLV